MNRSGDTLSCVTHFVDRTVGDLSSGARVGGFGCRGDLFTNCAAVSCVGKAWRRRKALWLTGVLCAALAFAPLAQAYRHYSLPDHLVPLRGISYQTWDPEYWPPGGTLSWTLLDDPAWSENEELDGIEDVRRVVEDALAVWTEVATADIHWEIGQIAESLDEIADPSLTSLVSIGELPSFQAGTAGQTTHEGLIRNCEIVLDREFVRVQTTRAIHIALVHELGHCLGLRHSGVYPNKKSLERNERFSPATVVWRYDPVMSYGSWHPEGELSLDDMVGASLLRPQPGWLESTGSIGGTVLLDRLTENRPASHVLVLATRLRAEDGRARGGVSVFTDLNGDFLIRGLAPGKYVLYVHQIERYNAHSFHHHVRVFDDMLQLKPVEVLAGEQFGPVVLSVRRWPGAPR